MNRPSLFPFSGACALCWAGRQMKAESCRECRTRESEHLSVRLCVCTSILIVFVNPQHTQTPSARQSLFGIFAWNPETRRPSTHTNILASLWKIETFDGAHDNNSNDDNDRVLRLSCAAASAHQHQHQALHCRVYCDRRNCAKFSTSIR